MTDDKPAPDPIVAELRQGQLVSDKHTILVRPYAYGQYRIQLCRSDRPDPFAPYGHGSIVRELCTYHRDTVARVIVRMCLAIDPETYCRSLETPANCESPGGRIRLDNREPFICPDCGAESWNANDKAHRYCLRCHKFFD